MTNTPEEYNKWFEIFQNTFKDITEEHRAAIRSMEAQKKVNHHVSSMPDMFGRAASGKAKTAKAGLSSIAMRRAATRKSAWLVKHFS